MKLSGRTIFITGGGSGIGRGLAEALHELGNKVIISGRRKEVLEETTKANAGMEFVQLDIEDPASIAAVAKKLIAEYPELDVLLNNAGIMKADAVDGPVDDAIVASTVATNLLGPIRLTSALLDHLKSRPEATILTVTSGLAFTPRATHATYSATKAAIHSYSLSLRYMLEDTAVQVVELVPPYVQTELTGAQQATDPRAMPLKEYIEETMRLLGTDTDEVLVERAKPQRNNAGPEERAFFTKQNDMLSGK